MEKIIKEYLKSGKIDRKKLHEEIVLQSYGI